MKFPLNKYHYYVSPNQNKVYAVSTYAGKNVRGSATCHPDDTFNLTSGKTLAALRCNEKVCNKRLSNAVKAEREAYEAYKAAEQRYYDMVDYRADAAMEWTNASDELNEFIHTLETLN